MNILIITAIAAGVFTGNVAEAPSVQDAPLRSAAFSGSAGSLTGYEF